MKLREAAQQALTALENDAMQRTFAGGVRISNAAIALRAALADDDGWRQCAKGQRTTQYCGLLEEAVRAEREACAKACEDTPTQHRECYMDCVRAIRARGEA